MNITSKVNQNKITEKIYRGIKGKLSYSALRGYAMNRTKFYKEFVCGETVEKEQSVASLIGDISHTLLADNGEFDNKFHIASAQEPKGQMLELVNNLYKRALKSLNEEGVITENFETLFLDAVNTTKYDFDMKEVAFKGKNAEKIVELFSTPDKDGILAELYYKELLSCTGKQVVSINNITTAEKAVEKLKTHEYTRDIVNLQTSGKIEVFNELMIFYTIDGVTYKSMIDKLVANHEQHTLTPWDYKFTWTDEDGFEYSYMKNMYHLQVGLYDIAIREFCKEHELEGYEVLPMNYIAMNPTGNNAPVIYRLTDKDVEMAKNGYTVRGKRYPGVLELIDSITWHTESGNWETTKALHENKGLSKLGIVYDM